VQGSGSLRAASALLPGLVLDRAPGAALACLSLGRGGGMGGGSPLQTIAG